MTETLEPQGNQPVVKEKAKQTPAISSYWTSYLSHKQSLNFVMQDFDWLHMRRLEAARKEEFERKLKKREDRFRSELHNFLQEYNIDKVHPQYGEFILPEDTTNLDIASSSMESEEMMLKRITAIIRKEYCWLCDGLCSLFQRRSQRYYDYLNRHFIRSIKALRRESLARPLIPPLVTEEGIHILYGKTLRVLTFLRSYKIPKIRANSESTDSEDSMISDDLDCERTLDNFPSKKVRKEEQKVLRPKRGSKFDYRDKFNSSDDEDYGFESGFSSGTESGISETSKNCNNPKVDKYPDTELDLQGMAISFAESDREDILSLFPEDEDIRLPT